MLPALYLMHGLLTGTLKAAPLRVIGLVILALGVFFSFSRAAWGLLAITMVLLVFTMLIKERTGAFRLKILVMTLIGTLLLIGTIIVALQFDQIADLFSDRAKLVQSYDGARHGRFERHAIGFLMAMEHPLGIGPLEFGLMWGEDTHNIWLKALMDYGWLGFVSYVTLIAWTLVLGFRYLPARPAMAALPDDRLHRSDRAHDHRQRDRHRPLAAFLPADGHRLGVLRAGNALAVKAAVRG
ncbi:MAG: hypothetical protein HoeaKO_15920 [Hoeflea alexandrii]